MPPMPAPTITILAMMFIPLCVLDGLYPQGGIKYKKPIIYSFSVDSLISHPVFSGSFPADKIG
jgi:hypothetical protein